MDQTDEQYKRNSIRNLKGVGERYADKLNRLGLFSCFDLLFNLPFRYLDKTRCCAIAALQADDSLPRLIEARVTAASFTGRSGKVFQVTVRDDSASLDLKYFNISANFARAFAPGTSLTAFGLVKSDSFTGALTMYQPEITFLRPGEKARVEENLTPVYHLTEKLPQRLMQKIEQSALQLLQINPLSELLPAEQCPGGLSLNQAITACHYPKPAADGSLPRPQALPQFKRLAFEELTAYLISFILRKSRQSRKQAPVICCRKELQQRFLQSLPFTPTAAQTRVMAEVAADLQRGEPMLRLVNGDVGSGKTLIAVTAALHTAHNDLQTVLLAPTEILARQHYQKCSALLEPLGVHCVFISSKMQRSQRNESSKAVKSGQAKLIIGTHAVFQDKMEYHSLGLIIIDEQHRFGVSQRTELLKKGAGGLTPHQLSLSATPIPRTLQLALYADLAVSKLDELPSGRSPIITAAVSSALKDKAVQRLKYNLEQGVQAYWVCPLIEENEDLAVNSVKETYTRLKQLLPEHETALLHGQMSTDEKNQVMERFADGEVKLLIATTIIEVGVDVPNASIMIIDSAERLGLAQLHQLRGRVGRGSRQSYCLLIYDEEKATDTARQRLEIMKHTTDGFTIAAEDLRLRGPGDATGTRQAGFDIFRLADVVRDLPLLEQARSLAASVCSNNPQAAENLVWRWFPHFFSRE